MNILLMLACASSTGVEIDTAATDAVTAKGEMPDGWAERCRPPLAMHQIFLDRDEDGYGDDTVTYWVRSSLTPEMYVEVGGDCDDTDAAVYPGNGCDDTGGGVDTSVFPPDLDGDGWYGDGGGDCDDNNDAVNPAAAEVGDRVDQDCDGQTDEGLGLVVSINETSGLAFPVTVDAWYGSGGWATADLYTATEYLVFAPNDADLMDHDWVVVYGFDGTSWTQGCTGFAVTSADHDVVMYEDPTGTYTNCDVFADGATPTGSRSSWTVYTP